MAAYKKITINFPGRGRGASRKVLSASWTAFHRGQAGLRDNREDARERLDRAGGTGACPESKDLSIPCNGELYEKVWGAAMVRDSEGKKQGNLPGAAYQSPTTGEWGGRGDGIPVKMTESLAASFIAPIGLVGGADKDLWVRINAWAGNWRRAVDPRRSPTDKYPGSIRVGVNLPMYFGSDDGKVPPFKLPVEVESYKPDCSLDNLDVTKGNEPALKKHYGSYLPTGENPCGGEGQVHCDDSTCQLEQVRTVRNSAGSVGAPGDLTERVAYHTDSGAKSGYIYTQGGFRFSPVAGQGAKPERLKKERTDWGSAYPIRTIAVCVSAFFRCTKKAYKLDHFPGGNRRTDVRTPAETEAYRKWEDEYAKEKRARENSKPPLPPR